MATHKSAEKRHRQSLKRRTRNRDSKSDIREAIKAVRLATQNGKKAEAKEALTKAERLISKAAAKGVFHRRAASRKISRLASAVAKKTK